MANPFTTPQNERSFSGLVDSIVTETGRVQNLLTIIQCVNLVIRECQAIGLFARDAVEEQVVVDAAPFAWTRPAQFRSISAVKYGTCGVYPKFRIPGKQQANETWFFYAADDYYVFNGVSIGETISFLNYYWARRFLYYARVGIPTDNWQGGPYNPRLAYYDIELDIWKYLNATSDAYVNTTGNADTDALYRKLSSHWLIEDWYDLIGNGTKAKVYAQFNDTDRANRAFALYKIGQALLKNTTGFPVEVSAMDLE